MSHTWYLSAEAAMQTYRDVKLRGYANGRKKQYDNFKELEIPLNGQGTPVPADYFSHYARLLEFEVGAAATFSNIDEATTKIIAAETIKYKDDAELKKDAATKYYADLLYLIKQFEIAVYNYDGRKQEQATYFKKQIEDLIKANAKNHAVSPAAAIVLTKLIQLQHRISAQFGNDYNFEVAVEVVDSATNQRRNVKKPAVTAFTNYLKARVSDFPENIRPHYNARIDAVIRVANDQQKLEQTDTYNPGFFGGIGRWFKELFSSKSRFRADSPEKELWSDCSAIMRHKILPLYLSKGSDGNTIKADTDRLLGKLAESEDKSHDETTFKKRIGRKFADFLSFLSPNVPAQVSDAQAAPVVPADASGEARPVVPLEPLPLDSTQLSNLNQFIFSELLKAFKHPKGTDPRVALDEESGRMPSPELLSRNLNGNTAYPIWPREILITGSNDSLADLSTRAKELAECVRRAIESGFENRDVAGREQAFETTKLMAEFILPALQRLRDMRYINSSACYTTPPKDFVGLQYYKEFLAELYKRPLKFATADFPADSSEKTMQNFWHDLANLNENMKFYQFNSDPLTERPEELVFADSVEKAQFEKALDNVETRIWDKTTGIGLCPEPRELFCVDPVSEVDKNIVIMRANYIKDFYKTFADYRYRLRQEVIKTRLPKGNESAFVKEKAQIDAERSLISELRRLKDVPPYKYLKGTDPLYAKCPNDIKLLAALNYLADAHMICCGENFLNEVPTIPVGVRANRAMYFSASPLSTLSNNKAFTKDQHSAMLYLLGINRDVLEFIQTNFISDTAKPNANNNYAIICEKLYKFVDELYSRKHARLSPDAYARLASDSPITGCPKRSSNGSTPPEATASTPARTPPKKEGSPGSSQTAVPVARKNSGSPVH